MELFEETIGNEQWSSMNKGADGIRWMGSIVENMRYDLGKFELKQSALMMYVMEYGTKNWIQHKKIASLKRPFLFPQDLFPSHFILMNNIAALF